LRSSFFCVCLFACISHKQHGRTSELFYTVSKNVPSLTCYNLDIHDQIMMIFGTSVTEKVRNNALFSRLTYLVLLHYLAKEEEESQKTMYCACNTVQLLQRSRLPFSRTMPPTAPTERIDHKIYGVIQQHEYEF